VSDVVDGAFFHLPLFLRLGHIASNGRALQGPQSTRASAFSN
jgi:hypothetical protein